MDVLLELRYLCAGMVTGSWPPGQFVFRLWFQYELVGLQGQSSYTASSVFEFCLSSDIQMCLLDNHSNEKKRNAGFLLLTVRRSVIRGQPSFWCRVLLYRNYKLIFIRPLLLFSLSFKSPI